MVALSGITIFTYFDEEGFLVVEFITDDRRAAIFLSNNQDDSGFYMISKHEDCLDKDGTIEDFSPKELMRFFNLEEKIDGKGR